MMEDFSALKAVGHFFATGGIVGSIFSIFPFIAAFVAFIWYLIQIYESRTFQHWRANFLMRRRAKKLARLHAKEKIVAAQIAALEKVRQARAEARDIVADAATEAANLINTETTRANAASIVEAAKPLK
jgi:hypothetical protein